MNENELLECLSIELESIAETLILVQKDEKCDEYIKKVLNNQIGMLFFCQKEIHEIIEMVKLNKLIKKELSN